MRLGRFLILRQKPSLHCAIVVELHLWQVAGGNTTTKPCALCFCAIWHQLKNKGLVTSVLEACKSRPGGLLILLLGPV